jgi:hypothetical protein
LNKRGVALYGNIAWKTSNTTTGTLTDWLFICGKNDPSSTSVAGSILIDGNAQGIASGGAMTTIDSLKINTGAASSETSGFSFSSLIIWDTILTDAQMLTVENQLMSWGKDPNFGTSVVACQTGHACLYGNKTWCSAGKYANRANVDVSGSAGYVAVTSRATQCTTCEAGYFCPTTSIRAPCPAGSYGPSTAAKSCTPCPPGQCGGTLAAQTSASSACKTCNNGTWAPSFDFATLSTLISGATPWGIYSAASWDSSKNKLPEMQGNTDRDATTTGTFSQGIVTGNGATAYVDYISGDTTGYITWPVGSLPTTFTICSVTRYTGSTNAKRIIQASGINFIHGHDYNDYMGGMRGMVFYNMWLNGNAIYKTQTSVSVGTLTNWLVACGKNDATSVAGSVLIDGVASGVVAGGTVPSVDALTINTGTFTSDFAFSSLIVWNTALTDSQMATVSTQLLNWLNPPYSSNPVTSVSCPKGIYHLCKRNVYESFVNLF